MFYYTNEIVKGSGRNRLRMRTKQISLHITLTAILYLGVFCVRSHVSERYNIALIQEPGQRASGSFLPLRVM